MSNIIGGIVIALVFAVLAYVPEEPTTINLTAEDCKAAPGKCYGP